MPLAKITLTIENEETGFTQSATVHSGDSAWTDHKFFLLCARSAAIRLSESLHTGSVLPENEDGTCPRHPWMSLESCILDRKEA